MGAAKIRVKMVKRLAKSELEVPSFQLKRERNVYTKVKMRLKN